MTTRHERRKRSPKAAALILGMHDHRDQPRNRRGQFTHKPRPDAEINLGALFSTLEIEDSCIALPDRQWVRLQLARSAATGPKRIAQLTDDLYDWVAEIDAVGTTLDDRDCLDLFTHRLVFMTPELDTVSIRVPSAAAVARRYEEVHGLVVRELDLETWLVEMNAWPPSAASADL